MVKKEKKVSKTILKQIDELEYIAEDFRENDRPTSYNQITEASRQAKRFYKLLNILSKKKIFNSLPVKYQDIILELEETNEVYDPKEDF